MGTMPALYFIPIKNDLINLQNYKCQAACQYICFSACRNPRYRGATYKCLKQIVILGQNRSLRKTYASFRIQTIQFEQISMQILNFHNIKHILKVASVKNTANCFAIPSTSMPSIDTDFI